MTLQRLKYFIRAAEYLNFTKAAQDFYMAQSAMTQQIQRLENELGVKLFERNNKILSLTPEGQIFLEDVRIIVMKWDQSLERMHNFQTGHKKIINISFNGQYERVFLPYLINAFNKEYPNVKIRINFYPLDKTAMMLEEKICDFAYLFPYEFIDNDLFKTQILFHDSISIAMSHQHPLSQKENITFRDLKNETVIMVKESSSPKNFKRMKSDLENHHYSPYKIEEVQNFDTMILMVEAGEGIAFVPSFLKLNASSNIKFYPIENYNDDFYHDIAVVYLKSNNNPLIQSFIESSLNFFEHLKSTL